MLLVVVAVFIVSAVGRAQYVNSALIALRPALAAGALGLLLLFFQRDPRRRFSPLATPVGKLAAFLVVWASLGGPFATVQTFALKFWLEDLIWVLALMALIVAATRDLADLRRLMHVFAASTVLLCLFSMALGSQDSAGRLSGLGGYDPNDLAFVAAAGIPLLTYGVTRARTLGTRLASALGIGLLIYSVVQTDSRGGFLAIAAFLLFSLFAGRGIPTRWRVAIAGGAIVVLLSVTAGGYWTHIRSITDPYDYNRTSLTGRKQVWKRGMGYMFGNPVFGVGLRNFSVAEGQHPAIAGRIARGYGTKYSAAHSSWVEIGAETGLPGFAAFIGLFLVSGAYLFKVGRRTRAGPGADERAMAFALLGLLVTVAVGGSFLSQGFGFVTWGTFGLVAAFMKVRLLDRASPNRSLSAVPDETAAPRRRARVAPLLVRRGVMVGPGFPGGGRASGRRR